LDKIKISLEFNTIDDAIEALSKVRNIATFITATSGSAEEDIPKKTPPAVPKKTPPAVPKKTPPAVPKKTPPAVPKKEQEFALDARKIREEIHDALVLIQKSGGNVRELLNSKNYTGINAIPDNEIVSFLEHVRGILCG